MRTRSQNDLADVLVIRRLCQHAQLKTVPPPATELRLYRLNEQWTGLEPTNGTDAASYSNITAPWPIPNRYGDFTAFPLPLFHCLVTVPFHCTSLAIHCIFAAFRRETRSACDVQAALNTAARWWWS